MVVESATTPTRPSRRLAGRLDNLAQRNLLILTTDTRERRSPHRAAQLRGRPLLLPAGGAAEAAPRCSPRARRHDHGAIMDSPARSWGNHGGRPRAAAAPSRCSASSRPSTGASCARRSPVTRHGRRPDEMDHGAGQGHHHDLEPFLAEAGRRVTRLPVRLRSRAGRARPAASTSFSSCGTTCRARAASSSTCPACAPRTWSTFATCATLRATCGCSPSTPCC